MVTGSQICTSCSPGMYLNLTSNTCYSICGDGNITGKELCDDGGKGSCNLDCSGSGVGFLCYASITNSSICYPICGDGIVVGNEVCDDGKMGGCN